MPLEGGDGLHRTYRILLASVLVLAIGAAALIWSADLRPLAYIALEQGAAVGRTIVYYVAPTGAAVPVTHSLPPGAPVPTARLWSAVALLTTPSADRGLSSPLPAGASLRRIAYVERATAATAERLVAEIDFRYANVAPALDDQAIAVPALAALASTVAAQSSVDSLRVLINGSPLAGGAIGEPTGLPLSAFRGPLRWRPLRCGARTLLAPERASLIAAGDADELSLLRDLLNADYAGSILPKGTRLLGINHDPDGTIVITLNRSAWPLTARTKARLQLAADALALTARSISAAGIRVCLDTGALVGKYRDSLWPNPE